MIHESPVFVKGRKRQSALRSDARIASPAGGYLCSSVLGRSFRQYWVQSLSVQDAQVSAALAPSQKRSGCRKMKISHTAQAAMDSAAYAELKAKIQALLAETAHTT